MTPPVVLTVPTGSFLLEAVGVLDRVVEDLGRYATVGGIAVQVVDGLARGAAGVEADVAPVGRVALVEQRLHLVDQVHQVVALVARSLPPAGNEPPRHDERMAGLTGKASAIANADRFAANHEAGGISAKGEGGEVTGSEPEPYAIFVVGPPGYGRDR